MRSSKFSEVFTIDGFKSACVGMLCNLVKAVTSSAITLHACAVA